MSLGLAFWILMLLWLVSWVSEHWSVGPAWGPRAGGILLFLLLFLLGWHSFGFMLQGR
jgi:hypothetical protein